MTNRLVILESPFAGDVARNTVYARQCVRDCLKRGESPIASHLLFTQAGVLDDGNPEERRLGIMAGLAWLPHADASVVYTDHGTSPGMKQGIAAARRLGIPVEFRRLGVPFEAPPEVLSPELRERWDRALGTLKSLGSFRATPSLLASLEVVAERFTSKT